MNWAKLLSARFWLAMGLGGTFCWMAIHGNVPAEVFTPIVGIIITSYFDRKDRKA